MTTTVINTAEAKDEFSELVNRVAHHKERVILTRRGKEIAAIVSYEDFLILMQAQQKNDLQDAVEALKLAREQGAMPLDELKEELG